MYQFYRGGRCIEQCIRYVKALAGGIDEQWPDAFPAVEYGVAHGFMQLFGSVLGGGQDGVQFQPNTLDVVVDAL